MSDQIGELLEAFAATREALQTVEEIADTLGDGELDGRIVMTRMALLDARDRVHCMLEGLAA